MTLIDNWKSIAPRLWSVRLSLVAAVLSALETGMNLYTSGTAPVVVIASLVVSVSAAVARVVAQPGVVDAEK